MRGGGLKQQKFISQFWEEAGKLKIKVSADLVPGESSLPSLDTLSMSTQKECLRPFLSVYAWRESVSSLVSLLTRTPIVLDQNPSLMPLFNLNYFCKCPLSIYTVTLDGRTPTYQFWCGSNHSVPNRWRTLSNRLGALKECNYTAGNIHQLGSTYLEVKVCQKNQIKEKKRNRSDTLKVAYNDQGFSNAFKL